MESKSVPSSKKPLLYKLVVAVLVLGTLWVAVQNLPRGYSRDLTQIGKGSNVVVHVHDHNLMNSIGLMEGLNKIRPEYAESVIFVVADLTMPQAQEFAVKHNAESATLLYFAPDGTPRGSLTGLQSPESLRASLNQAFGL